MELQLGYQFLDEKLIETAITHTSFRHESKSDIISDNERLEFLGDAVLELTISSYIYKHFDEFSEGQLTKLRASIVCEETLAQVSLGLNIGKALRLGKGEEQTGGRERPSLLSDAFEAIIGAIYIDSKGIKEAEKFILKNMEDIIKEKAETFEKNDCKTYLQEIIQKDSQITLCYNIISEEGPAHAKIFTIEVVHDGKRLGLGKGKSKKDAEQTAAYEAIKYLENK